MSHLWKAVSAGVQPFLNFTVHRIGIEATVGVEKNPATLAAGWLHASCRVHAVSARRAQCGNQVLLHRMS
tara:strand:- start:2359 stop:2568 length:210 start_codon:yes stop_codon:yes gene_type:complete